MSYSISVVLMASVSVAVHVATAWSLNLSSLLTETEAYTSHFLYQKLTIDSRYATRTGSQWRSTNIGEMYLGVFECELQRQNEPPSCVVSATKYCPDKSLRDTIYCGMPYSWVVNIEAGTQVMHCCMDCPRCKKSRAVPLSLSPGPTARTSLVPSQAVSLLSPGSDV